MHTAFFGTTLNGASRNSLRTWFWKMLKSFKISNKTKDYLNLTAIMDRLAFGTSDMPGMLNSSNDP
jgi:hypothetical protein